MGGRSGLVAFGDDWQQRPLALRDIGFPTPSAELMTLVGGRDSASAPTGPPGGDCGNLCSTQ